MYGIAGERRLTEWEVPWLPGYEGSAPVRIGNAAYGQLPARRVRRGDGRAPSGATARARRAANPAGTCSGRSSTISSRSGPSRTRASGRCAAAARHFTYSKVMAWVAFDRAIKSAEEFKLDGPLDAGAQLAAEIHADVCRRGFDAELGSFVQSYGSKQLDASLLLLPEVGFLPPDDPRVRGTMRAIEQRLLVDGFVHALRHRDSGRRPAAGRGRVPRLQLLAGRRLHPAEPLDGCARDCSSGCWRCATTSAC